MDTHNTVVPVPLITAKAFYKGERWYGHRFSIPGHCSGTEMQTQGNTSKEADARLKEYCDRVLGKDKYILEIVPIAEPIAKEFTGR